MSFRIVGIGELLWDMLPTGKVLGGAPANFACQARGIGADATMVSAVGNDALGREIQEALRERGFDVSTIGVNEHPTGTVTVDMSADGQPTYTIHESVAWDYLTPEASSLEVVARAHALSFGSLAQRSPESRAAVRELVKASEQDALKVFDVNLRQNYYSPDLLEESLQLANALKLNEDELPIVASLLSASEVPGSTDPGEERLTMEQLRDHYDLRLVALTRGSKGSLLFAEDSWSERAGREVKVVDTVGAGDAFLAGLVVGILKGLPLDAINEHATALAAFVCENAGATPAIPEMLRQPFRADGR